MARSKKTKKTKRKKVKRQPKKDIASSHRNDSDPSSINHSAKEQPTKTILGSLAGGIALAFMSIGLHKLGAAAITALGLKFGLGAATGASATADVGSAAEKMKSRTSRHTWVPFFSYPREEMKKSDQPPLTFNP